MNGRCLSALAVLGVLAFPSVVTAETIAITGAKVHTEPGKVIDGATVVIRNGKVVAVGKNAAVPAGARRIDATGKVVTAGFVDASSRLGLVEVGAVDATNEGRHDDGLESVHAAYRVTDGYNPTSVAIPIARTGGLTSAVPAPRGGVFAGSSAWVTLADGTTADNTVADPLAIYTSLGEGALPGGKGNRGAALERVREVLDDAAQYARSRRNYERNQTREFAADRLDLEALQPVLRGRIPLVVRAHRSSDILAAVRLGRELGIRVVIEGGTEAWRVADELARAKVPVILDPTSNLPRSFDRVHVRDDAAARLIAAGVVVAVSTLGDAANARTLRQNAGVAVAHGLAWDRALASVTTAPATIFGVRRGTIARGAAADLVVWSGDPFELSTRPEHVFVAGEEQTTRTRQTLLLERYR